MKCPTEHKTAPPPTKDYMAPNVSSTEGQNPESERLQPSMKSSPFSATGATCGHLRGVCLP